MKLFYDRRTRVWHQAVGISSDGATCFSVSPVIPLAGDAILQRFSGHRDLWEHAIPAGLAIVSESLAMNSDYNTFTLGSILE